MPKKKKKKGGGKKKAASSKGSRGRSSKSSKRSKSRSKSSKRSKRKKSRSKTPTQVNDVVSEDPLDAQINHGPRSVLNLSCLNINRKMGATILEIALPYISHWNNLQKIYLYGHGFNDIRRLVCAISLAKSPIIDELDISYNSIGEYTNVRPASASSKRRSNSRPNTASSNRSRSSKKSLEVEMFNVPPLPSAPLVSSMLDIGERPLTSFPPGIESKIEPDSGASYESKYNDTIQQDANEQCDSS